MIYKIGESEYNGKTTPVVLVVGKAQKDAEDRTSNVGSKMYAADLYVGKVRGEACYVSINGWGDRATEVGGITQGQYVLAIGKYEEKMNGKYTNRYIRLDQYGGFVSVSGAAYSMPQMLTVDDGTLPF